MILPDSLTRGALRPRELAVYIALLSRAQAGVAEVTYEQIAADARVARRQVTYALDALEASGAISRERTATTSRYHFAIDVGAARLH